MIAPGGATPAPALVSLHDVIVEYRSAPGLGAKRLIRALDGVSLEVREREVVGLVGESGSGKTTLARVIAGMAEPRSGRLQLGPGLAQGGRRRRTGPPDGVQYVFQGSSGDLNPVMTVRRTLLDVCSANLERKSSDVRVEDERRIEAAMAAAHLSPDFLERYPHELSGGEHQRVSIARGLIPRPKLLILDEPTAALDAATKLQIVRLLANLTSRRSFAVLIVSHDVPVIRAVADRVAVMFRGRMVESGNTCDVLNHPREDYTRTLIAASTYTTLPTTPGTLAH